MSYSYDIFQYFYAAGKAGKRGGMGANQHVATTIDYKDILDRIRNIITSSHSEELRDAIETGTGEEEMKPLIQKLIYQQHTQVKDIDDINELTDRLYEDMFGFSVLTKYIRDPDVQEINCNRWDDVEIITRRGMIKMPERFTSAIQAADVAKRMCALGGLIVDAKTPRGDSYITEGVRIHIKIPPVIDDEAGVQFSIRKQRRALFSSAELINLGTATQEELELLTLCLSHGVSIGVAGNTGSGKTTDIAYLCSMLSNEKRIYTIEDTRELNLERKDKNGRYLTRIMHTKTRYSDDPDRNVDAAKLVRDALRCDPDVIVPSEMRGAEALDVVEAGRTGHTIISSFHANNARDAYARIVSMAMMAEANYTEDMLMRFACSAFPIICFKKRMADGSRKYIEIIEAIEQEDGSFLLSSLFRYQAIGSTFDESGKVMKVQGIHKRLNPISDNLARRLLLEGAPLEKVRKFAWDDFDPTATKNKKRPGFDLDSDATR